MSTLGSISTALTALQAHRRAMDVTGNNIANVNTPGYTRQRVDLEPRVATGASSMSYNQRLSGFGVEVVGTSRLADEFLTARVRSQTSSFADLQARAQTLTEVERTIGEPSDTGLSAQLSEMWNAWSTLGANPDDLAAKTVLANKSQAVIDTLSSQQRRVDQLWTDQHGQARALTNEVNGLSTQIAALNEAVLNTQPGGAANELLDQRDQLVTRFIELTGATALPVEDDQVNIYLGGNPAVAGIQAYAVKVSGADQLDGVKAADPGSLAQLSWVKPDGPPVQLTGGQLSGVFAALNETLPDKSGSYDKVAEALVLTVNAGYKNTDPANATPPVFFDATGTTAKTLALSIANPKDIVAGNSTNGAKDGSVANDIGGMRTAEKGPDAAWNRAVIDIGVQVQAARAKAATVQQTLTTAVADQQSTTGVSLDEETANLLMMQRAYEGAARVLTAVDQALDTLINRTGLVGR